MPHLLVVELRSDPLIKGLLTRLVLRNSNKAGLYLSSECLLCFIRTKDIVATVLDIGNNVGSWLTHVLQLGRLLLPRVYSILVNAAGS